MNESIIKKKSMEKSNKKKNNSKKNNSKKNSSKKSNIKKNSNKKNSSKKNSSTEKSSIGKIKPKSFIDPGRLAQMKAPKGTYIDAARIARMNMPKKEIPKIRDLKIRYCVISDRWGTIKMKELTEQENPDEYIETLGMEYSSVMFKSEDHGEHWDQYKSKGTGKITTIIEKQNDYLPAKINLQNEDEEAQDMLYAGVSSDTESNEDAPVAVSTKSLREEAYQIRQQEENARKRFMEARKARRRKLVEGRQQQSKKTRALFPENLLMQLEKDDIESTDNSETIKQPQKREADFKPRRIKPVKAPKVIKNEHVTYALLDKASGIESSSLNLSASAFILSDTSSKEELFLSKIGQNAKRAHFF